MRIPSFGVGTSRIDPGCIVEISSDRQEEVIMRWSSSEGPEISPVGKEGAESSKEHPQHLLVNECVVA